MHSRYASKVWSTRNSGSRPSFFAVDHKTLAILIAVVSVGMIVIVGFLLLSEDKPNYRDIVNMKNANHDSDLETPFRLRRPKPQKYSETEEEDFAERSTEFGDVDETREKSREKMAGFPNLKGLEPRPELEETTTEISTESAQIDEHEDNSTIPYRNENDDESVQNPLPNSAKNETKFADENDNESDKRTVQNPLPNSVKNSTKFADENDDELNKKSVQNPLPNSAKNVTKFADENNSKSDKKSVQNPLPNSAKNGTKSEDENDDELDKKTVQNLLLNSAKNVTKFVDENDGESDKKSVQNPLPKSAKNATKFAEKSNATKYATQDAYGFPVDSEEENRKNQTKEKKYFEHYLQINKINQTTKQENETEIQTKANLMNSKKDQDDDDQITMKKTFQPSKKFQKMKIVEDTLPNSESSSRKNKTQFSDQINSTKPLDDAENQKNSETKTETSNKTKTEDSKIKMNKEKSETKHDEDDIEIYANLSKEEIENKIVGPSTKLRNTRIVEIKSENSKKSTNETEKSQKMLIPAGQIGVNLMPKGNFGKITKLPTEYKNSQDTKHQNATQPISEDENDNKQDSTISVNSTLGVNHSKINSRPQATKNKKISEEKNGDEEDAETVTEPNPLKSTKNQIFQQPKKNVTKIFKTPEAILKTPSTNQTESNIATPSYKSIKQKESKISTALKKAKNISSKIEDMTTTEPEENEEEDLVFPMPKPTTQEAMFTNESISV